MSDNIDAEITVKFKSENLIDQATLDDVFEGDLAEWVKELIQEEGLFGVVEDEFEILEVKEC